MFLRRESARRTQRGSLSNSERLWNLPCERQICQEALLADIACAAGTKWMLCLLAPTPCHLWLCLTQLLRAETVWPPLWKWPMPSMRRICGLRQGSRLQGRQLR